MIVTFILFGIVFVLDLKWRNILNDDWQLESDRTRNHKCKSTSCISNVNSSSKFDFLFDLFLVSVRLQIVQWFCGMSIWMRSCIAYVSIRMRLWSVFGCLESMCLFDRDAVMCVAFNSEGNFLASGSTDGKVMIWNVQVKRKRKQKQKRNWKMCFRMVQL